MTAEQAIAGTAEPLELDGDVLWLVPPVNLVGVSVKLSPADLVALAAAGSSSPPEHAALFLAMARPCDPGITVDQAVLTLHRITQDPAALARLGEIVDRGRIH